jgi:hypothetical protein
VNGRHPRLPIEKNIPFSILISSHNPLDYWIYSIYNWRYRISKVKLNIETAGAYKAK